MRRKFLSVVLCVCMMLTMVPFAFATDSDDGATTEIGAEGGSSNTSSSGSGGTTLQAQINAIDSTGTITLNRTYTEDVTIPANKNITLNLNGQTLKNVTTDTITVENGATLTVTGTGTVDNITHGKAALYNKGTVVLEGGTFERSAEAGIDATNNGGNSYYTVLNHGSMTVKSNVTVNNKGHYSSLFENGYFDYTKTQDGIEAPSLIIDGGKFDGGLNTIKNDDNATLTINDGTFINYTQAAFQNHHIATINGGTFTATDANAVLNCGVCSEVNSGHDNHVITINNGTFTGAINRTVGTISISGGTYSVDVSDFCAEGYYSVKDGEKYTVKPLNEVAVAKIGDNLYTSLSAAISAASNGQTVTLLKNATENVNISAEKSVAINLNGYTVTVPSDCGIELQGKLTVTGNGKITCANTPIRVNGSSAKLTVDSGTIESTGDYGIYAMNGGSVVVNDGTLTAYLAVLSGNNTTGDMNFEVNGGTLTSQLSEAIYMPGQVSLKVTGGTINGGISTRMGQITVTGGTINGMTGDTDSISDYYHYSGSAWIGDAIYVLAGTYSSKNQDYQNSCNITISGGTINGNSQYGLAVYKIGTGSKQTVNVNITGGKFSGSKGAVAVVDSGFEHTTCPPNNTPHVSANPTNVTTSTSISGGYFTTDPTAYVASGYAAKSSNKADYAYMVAKKENNEVIVKPAVATPKVELGNQIVAEKKEAVTASAQSVKVPEIANAAAKNVSVNDSQAQQYVKDSKTKGLTTTEGQEVILYVQSFLDVTPTAYDEATNTYTLDITPKYQIVASTATTADQINLDATATDKNAVVVKEATVLNVTEPTQVSFTLPDTFVTALNNNPTIYVKHTKSNGKTYIYSATLNGNTLTFTNPNGFSTFTVTTTAPVATVNGIGYESLQEAANAANNGDEITVNSGTSHTLDFNTTKSVKVTNKTGAEMTVKFNGTDKNIANNTTETFSYTRPSSGSTSTTYNVNVNAATNGVVAADKKTASKGTTVTVTASPSKGYVVDAVKVVDKDGKDVAVTGKDGKYVFTMPASAVTVTGSFKAETPAPVALPFTDVKSGNWFYDAVKYAYAQGLMTGTSATTFAPNGTMNRAMIVTVLYRLEKSPAVTGASKFTDVPAGQWYSDAVAWAAANKIVNGYDETTFGPMNAVTREQMAAILFRYEQYKGLENVTLEENLNRFPDQNKISAYAIPALQWAVGQKIINGNADGTLDPTGTATRAQVAQIFTNLLNQ